jgi:hypothetical protein
MLVVIDPERFAGWADAPHACYVADEDGVFVGI